MTSVEMRPNIHSMSIILSFRMQFPLISIRTLMIHQKSPITTWTDVVHQISYPSAQRAIEFQFNYQSIMSQRRRQPKLTRKSHRKVNNKGWSNYSQHPGIPRSHTWLSDYMKPYIKSFYYCRLMMHCPNVDSAENEMVMISAWHSVLWPASVDCDLVRFFAHSRKNQCIAAGPIHKLIREWRI